MTSYNLYIYKDENGVVEICKGKDAALDYFKDLKNYSMEHVKRARCEIWHTEDSGETYEYFDEWSSDTLQEELETRDYCLV